MAEDKNGFLLYADLIHVVNELGDSDAGLLFKHILKYVNDQNPITDNLIVKIAFEPIKQQMKRDLIKWENTRAGKSAGGKASAEQRRKLKDMVSNFNIVKDTSRKRKKAQDSSTESTVTVTVTDIEKENTKEKEAALAEDSSLLTLPDSQLTGGGEFLHELQDYINRNFPNFSKLKPMTYEQAEKIKLGWPGPEIIAVLEAAENKKDLLKKYSNQYLTLNNWLKNHNKFKNGTTEQHKIIGEMGRQELSKFLRNK